MILIVEHNRRNNPGRNDIFDQPLRRNIPVLKDFFDQPPKCLLLFIIFRCPKNKTIYGVIEVRFIIFFKIFCFFGFYLLVSIL